MFNDDETLLYQLIDDIKTELSSYPEYADVEVKSSYEDFPEMQYPMVIIYEIENSAVSKYYDTKEHIINVTYQFTILAEQSETKDANENVRNICTIIRNYMRGERYHALKRLGHTPIVAKHDDNNVRIGYMRFVGQLDIDTHTIYRRN
jgi:hypothetical protein